MVLNVDTALLTLSLDVSPELFWAIGSILLAYIALRAIIARVS